MKAAVVWLAAVLSVAVAVGAFGSPGALASCPETISTSDRERQRAYGEFKRSVESSPLAYHLGRPVSCEVRTDDGSIRLTYESPTGAKLEAHRDEALEFTEQRLSEKGMSRPTALALLRRTERWAFGDKGCSIAWKKRPAMEADATRGTRENVYRGDDCNCQARLVYAGNVLTGLVFRSAC